jgi:hypothetical protein
MMSGGQFQKWGAGVLGVVSCALLVRLFFQINGVRAGNRRPRATASQQVKATRSSGGKAPAASQSAPDELARYNSDVKLDLLKQLEDRPLPELGRDPFEFAGVAPAKAAPVSTAAPPPAAPPPAPPPVSLKPMGYSEGKGGVKEAMVSDEDQVYVVHEGDSVGTRYKVIKITPTAITIEDATLHQTVDLPIPQ